MASPNTNAWNKNLSQLDSTLFPQTQQAYNQWQYMLPQVYQNIAGLPERALGGFDEGLNTYTDRANQMFTNAGFSPQEKVGMQRAMEAGFAAPTKAAADQIKMQATRTGQATGAYPAVAQLGRERGRMISAGLGGLQQTFGEARIQGQQNAMSLSQFPQLAKLQRMSAENQALQSGLQASAQAQRGYEFGTTSQLGAAGARAQKMGLEAQNSFGNAFKNSLASSLGSNIGSFGSKYMKKA